MKEEWLLRGAVVPVDVETTSELVAEIKRLIDVVGGMALAQPEQDEYLLSKRWVELTDKEILADDVLRYYFGLNGGAGPVSKSGRKIVDALEAKLKERNT